MSTRGSLQSAGSRLYEMKANMRGPISHASTFDKSPLFSASEAAKLVQQVFHGNSRSSAGRNSSGRSSRKELRQDVYVAVFDHIHPKIYLYERFDEVYRLRWCKKQNLNDPRARVLSERAIRRLLWLAGHFPPRAHAANVRLHLNAWHTNRRYQSRKYSPCCFCKADVIDSIEHILWCPSLQSLFPAAWRGNKAKCFFLAGPAEDEILLGGMLVYGIYAFHCFARHSCDTSESNDAIIRLITEVSWNTKTLRIWFDHAHQLSLTHPRLQRQAGRGWSAHE